MDKSLKVNKEDSWDKPVLKKRTWNRTPLERMEEKERRFTLTLFKQLQKHDITPERLAEVLNEALSAVDNKGNPNFAIRLKAVQQVLGIYKELFREIVAYYSKSKTEKKESKDDKIIEAEWTKIREIIERIEDDD